ncbi:AMP dependent CoA ligase, putative [Cordyceps militaris CM01]|uniref:Acyl-CoA ligase cm3C n=1 Tax=Cordyceps militaris (strain CM01) TaxID=983644 RepID=CM3C_CORMM|nr:AMP dependent CoA ligase, putative [Cordyceps militaris CM01]G3J455.1 RecName: Full=Acyl-CoA ligase cm3C; AltName: Full=Beauveriolides biosynthesis cluster protein C; AltName: Full=Cyclodepsipeptides cm3 biosynthesis cluster protein C [Cordyceps militaris CM01]EGX96626.1 AMP dependent CoA ligase, putative [Cordyceps militaris CM01]
MVGEPKIVSVWQFPFPIVTGRHLPYCPGNCAAHLNYEIAHQLLFSLSHQPRSRILVNRMIFSSPAWVPSPDQSAPDQVPIGDYVLSNHVLSKNDAPFVDAISGHVYTMAMLRTRVESLARGLAADLNWSPNTGSPEEKVVAIYSLNTVALSGPLLTIMYKIDYFILCWAVHRLNGICMPLHSTCTSAEITSHMITASCTTIFTCSGLMSTCLEAAKELQLPAEKIYTLALPSTYLDNANLEDSPRLKTLEQLADQGSQLPQLEPLRWSAGQGKSQVAFLCSTSGTSGRQKLAMLTHYGIITNLLQMSAFEGFANDTYGQTVAAAIPFSHSYGILIGHVGVLRGESHIVFPRFDMQRMLGSVASYRVNRLYLVPPILAVLGANSFLMEPFDLSSVTSVVTGAAALDRTVAGRLKSLQPSWEFLHAWGLTETCIVVTFTSKHDVWYGSSGSLLPGCQLRLVDAEGKDVENYDQSGEVYYKAPNMFVGYLGDHESTISSFDDDGWMRTGDMGAIQVSPNGVEHLFIRDRIKDMIKVKGMQVIPADVEAAMLTHPAVADVAVIGVPDELAGERAMAFVIRSTSVMSEFSEDDLRDSINDHLEDRLHETHWLGDRLEFVAEIPKSQSGKVLKKILREKAASN